MSELGSHAEIRADRGTSHWRCRCPHCGSVRLRKRQLDPKMAKRYTENADTTFRDKQIDCSNVAQYYCDSCQTPVADDERVDATTSK